MAEAHSPLSPAEREMGETGFQGYEWFTLIHPVHKLLSWGILMLRHGIFLSGGAACFQRTS